MPYLPLRIRGQALAGGRLPALCAPLVGTTPAELLAEAAAIVPRRPDLLEWRIDFFQAIADTAAVTAAARALREAAGGIPILFTRRSQREGGQPISVGEAQVVALYEAVVATGCVDALDWEMLSDEADVARMRDCAGRHGLALVLSSHDFSATPDDATLAGRFALAKRLGGDVAKLAVMPRSAQDVLRLLAATDRACTELQLPVISMAMGPLGAPSRICGGAFGSALTFVVGASASAPGQMPIEDVRPAVEALRRAMGA